MPQSLRSILGKPRISKRTNTTARHDSPKRPSCSKTRTRDCKEDRGGLLFPDKFPDLGDVSVLLEEHETLALRLRDVVQTMRYIRGHMFGALPRWGGGFTSTRTAELLNYRASLPGVVTMGHIHAVLRGTPPSRVEREAAELVGKGVLRRVRVDRRGGLGEALVEMDHVRALLGEGVRRRTMRRRTGIAFWRFLRRRPTALVVRAGDMRREDDDDDGDGGGGDDDDDDAAADTEEKQLGISEDDDDDDNDDDADNALLTHGQVNELLRAGFLTSCAAATPGNPLHVRPEDRTTLTSIAHVSRFASGTVSAVGGQNALHLAGGGGGGPAASGRRTATATTTKTTTKTTPTSHHQASNTALSFRIALPGHGRYLKLADAAVHWLTDALGRTRWGEGPEAWLRERFEARGAGPGAGQSPRWKDFWGLEWEWLLGQAVGLGVVEVFETGSVGKGVRLLGG
ncbi:hypothetical protein E4U55_002707 [Claviceps digitariae]|nr:hypothetical protein E4U55_002707 [Claviceps digitariae]